MPIDLTSIGRVFKREANTQPQVLALVVEKGNEAQAKAVAAAIKEAGFSVSAPVENEDGTMLYAQKALEPGATVVRMSDHLVALVKNLGVEAPNAVKADTHIHGPAMTATILSGLVQKAELEVAAEVIEYAKALDKALPEAVVKADELIGAAIKGLSQGGTMNEPKVNSTGTIDGGEKTPVADTQGAAGVQGDPKPLDTTDATPTDADELLKAPAGFDGGVWEGLRKDQRLAVLSAIKAAKLDTPKETDNTPPQDAKAVDNGDGEQEPDEDDLVKKQKAALDAALAPVQETLKNLSTALEAVSKTQKEQADQVAAISAKAGEVEKAVKGTVLNAAKPADAPAGGVPARKEDGDPRTGCFDTAFIKR